MNEIPLSFLYGALIFCILLSAFFSGSETGLMTLNRYRLRHLAKDGHTGAIRASKLLKRPDRLIGLILLGNNFVNILASSLSTIIAMRHGGEGAIPIAAGLLTLVILIFAEVAPKTLAATKPERIAFPSAFIYTPLLRILYPLVWVVNTIANMVLRMIGVRMDDHKELSMSREELRTVVIEAGAMIPRKHQKMLLNILDLEQATVEDIMIPRNEITGLDLEDEWDNIIDQLVNSQYTRLPVYRDSIDNIIGFIHLRNIAHLLYREVFSQEDLLKAVRETYFIPEATPLNKQLINFQTNKRRIGMVVDEYGDIMGLVTLEDILEEIVGEFTTDPSSLGKGIFPQEDGSYLVDGSTHIRVINRILQLTLPTDGPKTLNGLILEYLENMPEPGTSILLNGNPVEIMQTKANTVKTAKIHPRIDSFTGGPEHGTTNTPA